MKKGLLPYPNFFISETLERDRHKYYRFLNDTRYEENWNQWISFFLNAIHTQAKKNINDLYERTLDTAQKIISSSNIIPVVKIIFEIPVFRTKTVVNKTDISPASIRRYLAILEENKIIFSNGKQRNKTYYFYDLLDLIRG